VSTRSEQEAASRYADKLETVFQAYQQSFDLDIALTIVPLSDEERLSLEVDPDLLARVSLCNAQLRESLIMDLRDLSKNAVSEGVRLNAIRDLGKALYPKRFKQSIEVTTPGLRLLPDLEALSKAEKDTLLDAVSKLLAPEAAS
jgi:hypothetical protein